MESISPMIPTAPAIPTPSPERSDIEKATAKAFNVALILTGRTDLAEYAVAEAIRVWDGNEAIQEDLCLWAVAAAIGAQKLCSTTAPPELDEAAACLPLRLRNVIRLMPALRSCFVLRMLLGLSEENCACLLGSSVEQVSLNTMLALRKLADLDVANRKSKGPLYEGFLSN